MADAVNSKADEAQGKIKDEADATFGTIDTSFESHANKNLRSLFLYVQLLTLCFVCGYYFIGSPAAPTGGVLCRMAFTTVLPFNKVALVPSLYILNFVLDAKGVLLHHNPFTDSMMAVVFALFTAWYVAVTVFALPVLVAYAYFALAFVVPAGAYLFYIGFKKEKIFVLITDPTEFKKYYGRDPTEEEKQEAEAAGFLLKRLLIYSIFTINAFAVFFYPLYGGEGYGRLAERVATAVSRGVSLWEPEFFIDIVRWPRVSVPGQLALAVSAGTIALEYLLFAWGLALGRLYPRGRGHDGVFEDVPLCGGKKEAEAPKVASDAPAPLGTSMDLELGIHKA